MDSSTIIAFIREHIVALSLGIIGLLCVGYGAMSLVQSKTPDTQFQNLDAPSHAAPIIAPVSKKITIDIEGAVIKPGVYSLPADNRIQDALIVSGGLAKNADRQWAAQNLNLASPLTNSAKIYIPAVGEQYTVSGEGSTTSSGSVQGSVSGTVNINQASEESLDALPGIGPITAQKIISNRPYQTVQDLLTKKAVGQSEFEKIKDQISVY